MLEFRDVAGFASFPPPTPTTQPIPTVIPGLGWAWLGWLEHTAGRGVGVLLPRVIICRDLTVHDVGRVCDWTSWLRRGGGQSGEGAGATLTDTVPPCTLAGTPLSPPAAPCRYATVVHRLAFRPIDLCCRTLGEGGADIVAVELMFKT